MALKRDTKSMSLSLVIFSVSASPSLSQNGCISMLPVMSGLLRRGVQGRHTWVRDGGHWEDGRSGGKQSLSLGCQRGSGTLGDSARLRPQDKNVFDIVCNWVMFALLVSGGSASANRHLIVSYGRVKHSLWNSGRRGGSLDMELRGRFEAEDFIFAVAKIAKTITVESFLFTAYKYI